MRARLLVLLLLIGVAAPLWAQNTAGEVTGYVRDSTGAPLPGATVTVSFPDIAVSRDAQTNASGLYVLANLPNGVAEVKAELTGFQAATQKVRLEVNARARVDVTLGLPTSAEAIEVTAETPAISTRADVAHLISGEQTQEMPIDGRTYMQLLTLVPGTSRNDGSYEFGTSFRADAQQINGLRKNHAGLTLDGAENLDAGSNATQVNNVSIDAIEEVKVMTSQYSAEFGKAGGAQVNVVTKRGKKSFQGGAYGFLRDDRFDARNFRTGAKDVLDFKNFGWTLGGPVSFGSFNDDRSRLFFFAAQEWKRLDSQVGLTRTATVPSLLERQGDFSQSPRRPVDPLTGQPFPGGIIPAARLSRAGLALVSVFPLPDPSGRNVATLTPTQSRDIREDLLRLDLRTGPASNLSLRLIRDTVDQLEPYGSFGGTSAFAQVPTSHVRLSDSAVLTFVHPVGRRGVHEVTLSAVKNNQDLVQTGDLYTRAGIAVPEVFPSNRGGRAPNIRTMTGYSLGTGLLGNDYPTHIIGNYYTLKNNLTLTRGNHTLKLGTYLGHYRKSEELRRPDAGELVFSDNRAGGTGIALADALLGLYDRYTEADASPLVNLRYDQVEAYVQDHWQVRPNLTLDYGVRFQYMPGPYEKDDRLATFDPALYDPARAPQLTSTGNLVPNTGALENGQVVNGIVKAGVAGVPRSLYETDWNNLAPRVGFTWDPWKNGRTAVRGGFGVYFDRPVFNSTRDQGGSPPLVRTVDLSRGSLDNPSGGTASTAPAGGFEAVATSFDMPTIYSYSLGVQRTLPWKMVVDVNYVGNEAQNLLRVRELNFATPDPVTGVARTPVNLSRPYRGYGRISMNETTARSDYDSLQLTLNRRDADLAFGVAYTLSRARGDADSEDSTSSASLPQDPRDPGAEYGYQDFDRRHVLAVNYIYKLPFFRSQKGAAGRLLGGWQVSGITRYQSGRRLNVTAGTSSAIFGDTVTLRASLVPGQDPNAEPEGGRTDARWLNTAAFTRPGTNQLGNAPRNVAVGPSFFATDVALTKGVKLSGRLRTQLRLEAFNVFNTKNARSIETNVTNARFGAVTEYEAQRIVQLGLKVSF